MIERFIAWLFHKHEWYCTGCRSEHLGGEKYWWHMHHCMWCGKITDVMNADCKEFLDDTYQ